MDFSALTEGAVYNLTNKELINACKHFNIACGAINKTSRGLFEKKLIAALSSGGGQSESNGDEIEVIEEIFVENTSTPIDANIYNDTPYPVIRSSRIKKRLETTNSPSKAGHKESNEYEEGGNCDGEESVRILTDAERAERRARLFSKANNYEQPAIKEEKGSFVVTLLKFICFVFFLVFAYFFYREHMKRLQEENNDEL